MSDIEFGPMWCEKYPGDAANEIKRLKLIEMWAQRVTRHKGYGGYDLQAAYGGLEKALSSPTDTDK